MATDDVDTSAGFSLLSHFQDNWHKIHQKSEQNVGKAKKVLHRLVKLEESTKRRKEVLQLFLESSTNSFSDLTRSVKDIEQDMKQLSSQFAEIEQMLTVLQDHHENRACQLFEEEQTALQERHLELRSKEFELTKLRLEQEHQARVKHYELKQQAIIDERRRLYEKAFEEEMARYQQKSCNPE